MSGDTIVVGTEERWTVTVDDGITVGAVTAGTVADLTVITPGVQGPPGPQGETGPPGPVGPAGAARELIYDFVIPSDVWEAEHDLPVTPSAYAYDLNGDLIEGDPSYPTPTIVRVEWAWPMAGRLVLTT